MSEIAKLDEQELENFATIAALVVETLKPVMRDYRKEVWIQAFMIDLDRDCANEALETFDQRFPTE